MPNNEGALGSRRGVVKAGVAIVAAGAAGLGFARGEPRPGPNVAMRAAQTRVAQTKIAKAQLMYQDHPNGAAKCSTCAQFVPPDQCKIVEGPVSPEGWCAAYAPKPT